MSGSECDVSPAQQAGEARPNLCREDGLSRRIEVGSARKPSPGSRHTAGRPRSARDRSPMPHDSISQERTSL